MTTEERFRRLERENRWMKAGGGALVLCLLVMLFGGAGQDQEKQKVADEVRARKFVLVDTGDKVRATLENWPMLVLPPPEDDNKHPRPTYPCLTLRDADEQIRVMLDTTKLMMQKSESKRLLMMATGGLMEGPNGASLSWGIGNGESSVNLGGGNALISISAKADGSASVQLIDRRARPRAQLVMQDDGPKAASTAAYLAILDANGKPLLRLPK